MKKQYLLWSILILLTSCLGGGDDEVTESLDDAFVTQPTTDSEFPPACFRDEHRLGDEFISRKLDILIVPDTSGSIKDERSAIAQGFHRFIESLPEEVEYNIGVLLAHSPNSSEGGRLYQKGSEPVVLKSTELTVTEIEDKLDQKLFNPKTENSTDGGEVGMIAVMEALKPSNLDVMKSQGLFRDDAAIVVIFVADEQDICAKYPVGIMPVFDPNGKETRTFVDYCINDTVHPIGTPLAGQPITHSNVDIGAVVYDYKVTPQMVVDAIRDAVDNRPLVVGGVLYDENSTFPPVGENEIGYGYLDILSLTEGINVDLGSGDYGNGLENIGTLATAQMLPENSFTLKTQKVDPSSFDVKVDGVNFPFAFNSDLNVVTLLQLREPLSTTVVTYCEDNAAPDVQLDTNGGGLQNTTDFLLTGTVTDPNEISTEIFLNGVKVGATIEGGTINTTLTLVEGVNNISLVSTDSVGNSTGTIQLDPITVDLTPPQLLSISPEEGETITQTVSFDVTGSSNEELDRVLFNGTEIPVNPNGPGFSFEFTTFLQGEFTYTIDLFDKAGNSSSHERTINLVFTVLNQNLITIVPVEGSDQLTIVGAPGAARPNIEVEASAGFFNSGTVISNQDGSFEITLDFFNSVTLESEDEGVNASSEFDLSFNADTSLIGDVKDSQGNPLPGVKVTILNSNPLKEATTDVTGSFQIPDPPFGEQILAIDPSGIPAEILGTGREFFNTSLGFEISRTQINLTDTIYLNPLLLDGNETPVDDTNAVTVTSPHAPGFALNIPGGATTFPSGLNSGAITMALVDADKITIAPPEYAQPTQVLNLQPSGVTFSQPVEVVLPNDNEFPPELDVVLISSNSITGEWEINGVAQVDENGTEIRTKPGMGITHFSDIFAVPIVPQLSIPTSSDRPGVNITDNSMNKEISIPSYKSLEQDVAHGLIYRSNWADPIVIVKNRFDYEYRTIERVAVDKFNVEGFDITQVNNIESWNGPTSVDFQFTIGDFISEKGRFIGLPFNSLVTNAFNLGEVESGVYPYSANFAIQFRNLTINTRTTRGRKLVQKKARGVFGFFRRNVYQRIKPFTEEIRQETLLGSVVPQDLLGPLYLQNKKDSDFGRGWKFAGEQNVINTEGPRVMIEEESGELSIYNVDSKLVNLYEDQEGINAASLETAPQIVYSNDEGMLKKIDDYTDTPADVGTLPEYDAFFQFHVVAGIFNGTIFCLPISYDMGIQGKAEGIFPISSDEYLVTDGLNGVVRVDSSGSNYIAGGAGRSPDRSSSEIFGALFRDFGTFNITQGSVFQTSSCVGETATGEIPITGNANGSLSAATFTRPLGIVQLNADEYLVADNGNNLIRKINTATQTVSTFAGNGSSSESGDGGTALAAGIEGPIALTKDATGNIYIASESGSIRKIDLAGNISFVSGLAVGSGGVFADSTSIGTASFVNPNGLAFDDLNNDLYVADTDRNRVVRLSFDEGRAETVAGSGTCAPDASTEVNALEATLCAPTKLAIDSEANLLILDSGNNKIRKLVINAAPGVSVAFVPVKSDGSQLVRNTDSTWTRTMRDGDIINYNTAGQITSKTSRDGKAITYTYFDGKLETITDPVGIETNLTYNFDGKLESITDHIGRETSFQYSPEGELTTVTYPDLTTTNFTYDNGLITEEYNQNGDKRTYEYNNFARLTKVTDPDGSFREFDNEENRTLANLYTDFSEPPGQLEGFGEGEDGVSLNLKDSQGNTYEIVPAENGFAKKVIFPDGRNITFEYDLSNRLAKKTNSDGSFLEYSYNEFDDVIQVFHSTRNAIQIFEYNDFGQVTRKIDPRGLSSFNVYELTTGRLLSTRDHEGNETDFFYNSLGQVIRSVDHLGNQELTSYDSNGNSQTVTFPDGEVLTTLRDSAGNIIEKIDQNGNSTTHTFDDWNRLTSLTDEDGETFNYDYDNSGNLVSQTSSEAGTTLLEYDFKGRVTKFTSPTGQVREMVYDLRGNLVEQKIPSGDSILFEYDEKNRLTQKTTPEDIFNYEYDSEDNLIIASNSVSEITYTHTRSLDTFLVDTVTVTGKGDLTDFAQYSISNDYDLNGNRIAAHTSVGTFQYFWDQKNQLEKIINHKNEETLFSYDDINRLVRISNLGIDTDITYDISSHLMRIEHLSNTTLLSYYDFIRDDNGNRTQIASNYGTANYNYNNRNMLLTATNPQVTGAFANESFTYDSIGNRLTDQLGNSSYDSSHRKLEEDATYFYTYDLNGNQTGKIEKANINNVTNYHYDSENRLILAEKFDNSTLVYSEEYYYDAIGRRMQTNIVKGTTNRKTRYLWDQSEIYAQLDDSNAVEFIYTNSRLKTDDVLAFEATPQAVTNGVAHAAGSFTLIKDGIGSIISIRDTAGTIVQHYVYSAFGLLLDIKNSTGSSILNSPLVEFPFLFANREFSQELSLYYSRARFYDPGAGRFLQEDPHPGVQDRPETLFNRYIYVGNNPLTRTDPSGLFLKEMAIAFGVIVSGILTAGGTWTAAAFQAAALAATKAIMGTLAGSAVIAASISAFQGGNFLDNFGDNFRTIAKTNLTILAATASINTLFGGGIAAAGSLNGLSGFTQSKAPLFGFIEGSAINLGAVTNFHATTPGGPGFAHIGTLSGIDVKLGVHEFGHYVQYAALSAGFGRVAGRNAFLGLGVLGITPLGGWWEALSSSLGRAATPASMLDTGAVGAYQ